MENNMGWNESYSVGNATLDNEHKKLLALCAQAAACMEDNSFEGISLFHSILNDLCLYADRHFQTEEAILARNAYPQLAQQRSEHEEYKAQLADFLFAATSGTIDKEGLHQYLSNWWQHHILESDMLYKEHLSPK